MYAFGESKRGDVEGALPEETAPRAAPPPASDPPPLDGAFPTSGTRLISIPVAGAAPPIGLAEAGAGLVIAEREASATHRPTGDTTPPIVAVARADSATLEGLFSAAVIHALPGFG
jgi:hypothetical protein